MLVQTCMALSAKRRIHTHTHVHALLSQIMSCLSNKSLQENLTWHHMNSQSSLFRGCLKSIMIDPRILTRICVEKWDSSRSLKVATSTSRAPLQPPAVRAASTVALLWWTTTMWSSRIDLCLRNMKQSMYKHCTMVDYGILLISPGFLSACEQQDI